MYRLSFGSLILAFVVVLAAVFVGGLKVGSDIKGLVLTRETCRATLDARTAERDRLLEHLADAESSSGGTDCTPVLVWSCPAREVQP